MLDRSDFTIIIGNEMVSLFSKSKAVGTEILIGGLYKLNLLASYFESLFANNLLSEHQLKKTLTVYGIGV